MRGRMHSSDGRLPENDLLELADALAMRVHRRLGYRAFALDRRDVAELVAPYVSDLLRDDQCAVVWLVWDLLQEGQAIALRAA